MKAVPTLDSSKHSGGPYQSLMNKEIPLRLRVTPPAHSAPVWLRARVSGDACSRGRLLLLVLLGVPGDPG